MTAPEHNQPEDEMNSEFSMIDFGDVPQSTKSSGALIERFEETPETTAVEYSDEIVDMTEALNTQRVCAIRNDGVEFIFNRSPGNPEHRLPLKEPTKVLEAIGFSGKVLAEIRLGSRAEDEHGRQKTPNRGEGRANIWFVKTEEGTYGLVNAIAAEAELATIAEQGTQEEHKLSSDFLSRFTTQLHNERLVQLGRKNYGRPAGKYVLQTPFVHGGIQMGKMRKQVCSQDFIRGNSCPLCQTIIPESDGIILP